MPMPSKLLFFVSAVCLAVAATAPSGLAQNVYEESDGVVVIEMENTESPLGMWGFIDANHTDSTYPTGALGTGHLEFQGPFNGSNPRSPLDYFFKINQTGSYELRLRSHKRLLGASSDSNNDCFVKLAGNFTSGNPNIPQNALENDTKIFGGSPTSWGFARRLDGNGVHLEEVIYNLVAGETYQLTLSGRSNRFNIDRIILTIDPDRFGFNELQTLPESSIGDPVTPANAGLVWSESFTGDVSPFVDRDTEISGPNFPNGNFLDVDGETEIVGDALVILGNPGSDRIEFESTAAAMAGNFTFDLAFSLNDTDPSTPETNEILFLQMVDGAVRSTGGNPVPNFNGSINSNTLAASATFNYFFNVSGSDLIYIAPDGSTQILVDGAYDFWRDTTLIDEDNVSSNNSAGVPTAGVDTLILNAFDQTGTEGSFPTWAVDNASFNALESVSTGILLGDVDLDGVVDFLDISPFIAVLSGGGNQAEADCDDSGVVDFLDIAPFIAILSGS